jgi:1-acyl-sn-glycerol-3-phosphate acyltransferase
MKKYVMEVNRLRGFHILYFFVKSMIRIFTGFFRVEVTGKENIPLSGGVILCSNHLSYADPVIIDAFFPRLIFWMAKEEAFRNSFAGSFLNYFNTFPVSREL